MWDTARFENTQRKEELMNALEIWGDPKGKHEDWVIT
jgi:hypothetical protein